MDKKNLLSIGELSKITGVHIKALRYYDSLGILTPTFVDPDSGYRYYSFCQTAVVDAIQFCVELDSPLKRFHEFANENTPHICYADLVKQGADILQKKIRVMQERLTRLKMMQTEIERSESSFKNSQPAEYVLPGRDCWTIPYKGKQVCDESRKLTKKLILEIHRHGLHLGNTVGILLMRVHGQWQQFLFVDVFISQEERSKYPEIIHIPSGRYLCKMVEESCIERIWDWVPEYVTEDQIQYVIETELFTGNYYFSNPVLELRCLLP